MDSDSLRQQLAILQAKNTTLRSRVNKLERAENVLNIILEGTVAITGEDFFEALVTQLAIALDAQYVFLGELTGTKQDQIKTLAYWNKDQLGDNFEYDLLGSPCATVIGNKIQYYPEKTYALFPEDDPLVKKQIECYLGVPLFNSAGESIGIIVVMHDKILEKVGNTIPIIGTFAARAAAELERKQSEATLHESEHRYRLLVEQSNDVFFLMYKGRFELVNKSFYKLFNIPPDVVYDPNFNLLDLIHPLNIHIIEERLTKGYSSEMPPEQLEFMAQTRNGRSLPVSVSLSYLDYKEGTAVQGILRDLTQQREEEARAREQQEIAQALHEVGVTFSSSLELDVILDLLLEYVGRVVPYDSANVILVENGSTRIVRARGYEKHGININIETQPTSYNISETSTWLKMIANHKPIVIPDITQYDGWLQPTHTKHVRSWASAPIIVNGDVVAFLSTNKLEVNFYTQEHGNRLAAFAAQAALAWQNARSYAAATERADALNATGNILRALNAASTIQEALPTLVSHLQELTGAQRITIAQIDSDLDSLIFIGYHKNKHLQKPANHLRLKDTAATEDIKNGRIHFAPDITLELDYLAAQLLYKSGIRSYLSLPLTGRKNALGALTLSWVNKDGYNEDQIPFLEQIADAIALGMERSTLYNAAQYRSQELRLLYEVISAAASGSSQEDILQTGCVEIAKFLDSPQVILSLLDNPLSLGDTKAVKVTIAAQYTEEAALNVLGKQINIHSGSTLISQLVTANAPIIIDSLDTYTFPPPIRKLVDHFKVSSVLLIPITRRKDMIGIIAIAPKNARTFQDTEIQLLHTVAEELGRVLEITGLYAQLRHHAADLEMRVVARTQELADANEQLKALDKMKSRFVSDVSHELRTPVTNLKLYLDLLERRGASSLDQYLPILQKQADRLSQLIQDILDLSRLELSHVKSEFESLSLNELVKDIIIAHEPRAEASNLQIIFEPDDTLPPILGEWNQLAQVVTNLLANAINYSSEGKIWVKTMTLPSTPVDNMVFLEISDCGLGISPDDLPHLFDRFYRGQQIRQSNIPGTGLGLAIADEIVRIHNGRLEVESVEGEGSTFRVCLPLSPPETSTTT